jgi:hypothetical protein
LLARQIRWTFIAAVDYAPGYQVLELLSRNDICLPVAGSALMIPTSLGRWTREGAYWIDPPDRDRVLPMLSTIVTAALAATIDRSKRPPWNIGRRERTRPEKSKGPPPKREAGLWCSG